MTWSENRSRIREFIALPRPVRGDLLRGARHGQLPVDNDHRQRLVGWADAFLPQGYLVVAAYGLVLIWVALSTSTLGGVVRVLLAAVLVAGGVVLCSTATPLAGSGSSWRVSPTQARPRPVSSPPSPTGEHAG